MKIITAIMIIMLSTIHLVSYADVDKSLIKYPKIVQQLFNYEKNEGSLERLVKAALAETEDDAYDAGFVFMTAATGLKHYFGGYTTAIEAYCPSLPRSFDTRLNIYKGRVNIVESKDGSKKISYKFKNSLYVNGIKDGWVVSQYIGCNDKLALTSKGAAEAAKTQMICIMGICS